MGWCVWDWPPADGERECSRNRIYGDIGCQCFQTNEMHEPADSRSAVTTDKKENHTWYIPAELPESQGRREWAAVGVRFPPLQREACRSQAGCRVDAGRVGNCGP